MELREKIGKLHLYRRKSFRILLMAEIILIAAGIPGMFGKNRVYEFGTENMVVNFGTLDEETGSCFVDESFGQEEIWQILRIFPCREEYIP